MKWMMLVAAALCVSATTMLPAQTRTRDTLGLRFADIDSNFDGIITRDEWSAAFGRLDADQDGRVTQREFGNMPVTDLAQHSAAYRAGYERGRQEGIQAGKEDKPRHWDLEGQRELETADSGYEPRMGSHEEYQAGYRAGFRFGYGEGFGPR
jgi:hypothetical protein